MINYILYNEKLEKELRELRKENFELKIRLLKDKEFSTLLEEIEDMFIDKEDEVEKLQRELAERNELIDHLRGCRL